MLCVNSHNILVIQALIIWINYFTNYFTFWAAAHNLFISLSVQQSLSSDLQLSISALMWPAGYGAPAHSHAKNNAV